MIIHMSLYLRNSEFLKLHQQLAMRQAKTFDSNRLRVLMRQETVGGSYWSISDSCRGSVRSPKPSGPANAVPFGPEIVRDDYFGDINPRSLRRVVNALSLTGRLMRAFEIEFSWVTLAHWISLIEQWPYRMSWLIEYSNHCKLPDELTLKEVYNDIKDRIPTDNEMFVEMDRNQKGLDSYFHSEVEPQLCLSHVRTFIPFSSNLDPYVRRLIRDKLEEMEAPVTERNNNARISKEDKPCKDTVPLGVLKLFHNPAWQNVRLSVLSTQEVVNFLRKLPLSSVEATERYASSCRSANISGLVLSLCNLNTLKQELQMSFGDWEIFALIVNHLRAREASLRDEGKLSEPVTNLSNEDSIVTRKDRKRTLRHRKYLHTEKDDQEENTQHSWLRNRLGYLDSIDQEDAVEMPSSYVSSRCSSVTFEHADIDGNKEAVNSDFGAPHLSVCSSFNDKYHREKISCETTYSANVDANRRLLNSSDSEDETTQLTVQLKTVPSRPTILPGRKMTRASSEPGVSFEKLVIEDVQM